ncbi:MAG: type II toxin-antitoxin system PemK/MazF family toxin [Nocardioides sp.]|nr:type II toxin-antitoxin system PemK/MazF family toxin [Nocardioides sp.]
MVNRGDIHWCDLGEPSGSAPAKRRPVLVVQAAPYNLSRLATVVVVVLTSNTSLAAMPGNVFAPAAFTGLSKDSVVNVTAMVTIDRASLDPNSVGRLPDHMMRDVEHGLRGVLSL